MLHFMDLKQLSHESNPPLSSSFHLHTLKHFPFPLDVPAQSLIQKVTYICTFSISSTKIF